MKINENILSLPPYISTTWQNITGIFSQDENHIEIHLISGKVITVPMNDKKTLDLIFYYHLQSLETKEAKPVQSKASSQAQPKAQKQESFSLPFNIPFPMDGMLPFGQILQHQPDQSSMPDLPEEILKKVSGFAKLLPQENNSLLFPDVQPHCNCIYCQIGRAVNNQDISEQKLEVSEEEIISDDDLKFKEWDITKTADSLYELKNPLQPVETYQVYLGDPIGCTCGRNNCEHIKAVLNSEI